MKKNHGCVSFDMFVEIIILYFCSKLGLGDVVVSCAREYVQLRDV